MVDLSVALTGCSRAEAQAAVDAIGGLLAQARVEAEFLHVTAASEPALDGHPEGGAQRGKGTSEKAIFRIVEAPSEAYGDVLRAAVSAAQGGWLLMLDAPGPEDGALAFGLWHRRHEADLLIASRYVYGGSYRMPWFRRVVSRTLNRFYRFGLSVDVHDLSSARRMYRLNLLRKLQIQGASYDVLMETLLKFMAKGGRVREVPWHYESSEHRHPPGTALALIASSVATFFRLHALRNSVDFPDYDYRAYDSRVWLQRYWQRRRFQIIRGFAGPGGLVLDAGCGSSRIITNRPDMIAMDINVDRLRLLRTTNPRRVQATAGRLPFPEGVFDVVISSQVIEHTPERTCVSEAVRVLKPGGILVLGTPDYATFWWPITEKVYGWVKRGGYADEHVTHYTYASLLEQLAQQGCEVLEHRYIGGGELIIRATKTP